MGGNRAPTPTPPQLKSRNFVRKPDGARARKGKVFFPGKRSESLEYVANFPISAREFRVWEEEEEEEEDFLPPLKSPNDFEGNPTSSPPSSPSAPLRMC